ncbi:MAG TPA: M56 family metallopeptidase [Chitinophagaceae bacterium]|nr:M56 family metallopeptidase [Chitinophagaceae bacterium]
MSLLIQYLVKLTISLAVVWLFYQFILRKLTFYNSNRWYLLGYTLLSFFIPFINVSPLVDNRPELIQFVPSVHQYTVAWEEASECPVPIWSNYDKWDFVAFTVMMIAGILFIRFAISYLSFLNIRRKAKLISKDGVRIYQVDDDIIPFSFGNSIFINSHLHTESELQEIVRHEFVHVRQKHTIDILWAEMLCIINWYNPFAWLLRRSMRQNLEFIADNTVTSNGIDKKQYQYLLLKVIGNREFSIATQFNFSSLKKRIAMMNKSKSAKRQLGRFLFLVPVLAIILLSFRHSFTQTPGEKTLIQPVIADTIPDVTTANSKGYYIDIKDDNGNCIVVIRDKNKKEVKRVLLTEWNAKHDHYENLYGEILSPVTAPIQERIKGNNPAITSVTVKGNVATVTLKNGKTEVYTLSVKDQKEAFEERCRLLEVAVSSTVPIEINVVNETIAEDFEISDNKAVMKMRNGKVEEYNLADPKDKAAFEKKFGKVYTPALTTTGVYSGASVAETAEPSLSTTVIIAPANEVTAIREDGAIIVVEEDEAITIEPEILLTITQKTTEEELRSFQAALKTKGIEFSFDKPHYKNGLLVKISGTIRSKEGQANFVGVDFKKIIISQVKNGDKIYFRVDEAVKKKGVS